MKCNTRRGTRTRNPQIRSLIRYPLRQPRDDARFHYQSKQLINTTNESTELPQPFFSILELICQLDHQFKQKLVH
uniref:Uncharacterized protein n=1 Tax=Hyaloperonospora arabidopsidis (strain Emoy2) TaxID=559515 RepID=M4C1G1_HYAAE